MTSLMQIVAELPAAAAILLKITVLLAIGWLLHFALARRNPRWRVLMWRLVMVGLIVLPPAEWLLPKLRVKVEPPPVAAVIEAPAPPVNYAIPIPEVHAPVPQTAPAQTAAINLTIWMYAVAYWHWAAIAAWSLAVLAIAVRRVYVFVRLRRLVESSAPAPGFIRQMAQSIARALGCRAPGLRLTANLLSPFVTGIARPVVVIPSVLAEDARKDDLPAILAHELAHIRSRDLFWMALGRWISTILWFHPLAWRLRGAHGGACEEVCDAIAAEHAGGAPAYSRSLASTFLELVVDAPPAVGVPMIRPSEIMRRIRSLRRGIQFRALTHRRIAAATAFAALMVSSLGIIQFVRAEAEPPKAASRTIEFPAERSLGWVNVWQPNRDGKLVMKLQNAPAKGGLEVAAGEKASLQIAPENLEGLRSLKPGDIDWIDITYSKQTGTFSYEPLARLTGLKRVTIAKRTTFYGYVAVPSTRPSKPSEPEISPVSAKELAPLTRLPNLAELILWVNLADDDLSILPEFKRVRYLILKLDRVTGAGLNNLNSMPALERLDLSEETAAPNVDEARLAAIKACPNLKTLEIRISLSDKGLAALGPNPKLETLDLNASGLTDAGLGSLRQLTNLKTLRINAFNSKLTGTGFKVLSEMPSLQDVSIGIRGMSAEGLEAIRGLKSLTSLNISEIADDKLSVLEGMDRLAQLTISGNCTDESLRGIAQLPTLKSLSISGAGITDDGIGSITGLGLEFLKLSHTSITDAGVERLSRIPSLREVCFNGTKVTNAGLEAISRMKTVKTVTMHDTLVTSEAVARFKQAHPECTVFYQPRRKQFSVQIRYLDTHTTGSTEAGRAEVEAVINGNNTAGAPRILSADDMQKIDSLSNAGRLRIEPKRLVHILDNDRGVVYRKTTRLRNIDVATSKTITREIGDRVMITTGEDDKSGAIHLKQIEIMAPEVSELKRYDNITVEPGAKLLVNHPGDKGRYITVETKRIK